MRRTRVIPCLLLDSNGGVVKTERFGKRTYIGDPVNAVRIFNEKEVDELLLLAIDSTPDRSPPKIDLIEDIVSEAFMPVAYGGGVTSIRQIEQLFRCGLEKIVISTAATKHPQMIREAADRYGSQSIAACIDIRKPMFRGMKCYTESGRSATGQTPVDRAVELQSLGIGELIVNNIDRDGMMNGFDLLVLKTISDAVSIPVVACGGAGTVEHLLEAVVTAGCSAVSAGSMFVYQGKSKGILINYLDPVEIEKLNQAINKEIN